MGMLGRCLLQLRICFRCYLMKFLGPCLILFIVLWICCLLMLDRWLQIMGPWSGKGLALLITKLEWNSPTMGIVELGVQLFFSRLVSFSSFIYFNICSFVLDNNFLHMYANGMKGEIIGIWVHKFFMLCCENWKLNSFCS